MAAGVINLDPDYASATGPVKDKLPGICRPWLRRDDTHDLAQRLSYSS